MTPTFNRARSILTGLFLSAGIASSALLMPPAPARAGDVPTFAVDPSWPKQLPNNWIIGQVGGITVDRQGRHCDGYRVIVRTHRYALMLCS